MEAVIDAMEREMMDKIATKTDIEYVRELLAKDIEKINAKMDSLSQAITLRLILTAVGLVPAIVAAQKLF